MVVVVLDHFRSTQFSFSLFLCIFTYTTHCSSSWRHDSVPLIFFKPSAAPLHLCPNTSSLRLLLTCFSFLFHNYPPPPAACVLVAKFTTSHPSPFSLLPLILQKLPKTLPKNSSRLISASIQVTPLLLHRTFSTPLAHLSHILTPRFISSLLFYPSTASMKSSSLASVASRFLILCCAVPPPLSKCFLFLHSSSWQTSSFCLGLKIFVFFPFMSPPILPSKAELLCCQTATFLCLKCFAFLSLFFF